MKILKNGFRQAALIAGALLLVSSGVSDALAQVTTATIYGRTTDPSGAVVPGVNVTARGERSGVTRNTTTNEHGEFLLSYLPVDTYTFTVRVDGFKTFSEQNVAVSAGQKLEKIYRLELGMTTESVTVTGAAPLVNTTSAQGELRLGDKQMQTLPMINRDFTELLALGTGVSRQGGLLSINGTPPRGFSFSIDGVDAAPDSEQASLSLYQNYNLIKGVSTEAIQEVEVAKNIFSAEIGNTIAGNVNLITKSGSNEFHGSVFEYYRSGGMAAINHFTSRKTPLVFHQFGGSFGGAVVKDKVFFFTTYEGYRLNQKAPVTGNVPSLQVRDLITNAIPDPAVKSYFDIWPTPTEPEEPGDTVAFWVGQGNEKRVDDHGVGRVDYNATDNDRISVRYTRGHPERNYPRQLPPVAWRTFFGLNENISASYTRVWSPTLSSETRYGFNKSDTDRLDGSFKDPVVVLRGAGLPAIDGEKFQKFGTVTNLSHTFSQIKGQHSLKYGFLYRYSAAGRINEEIPQYTFATIGDILINRPSDVRYIFPVEPYRITRWGAGGFLQDDIRVNPRLMLNLGVRYDYDAVPSERDDRIFNRFPFGPDLPNDEPWNPYYAMISPRVGLALKLDEAGKTVIRSGFGVFFMPHTLFSGLMDMVKNGPGVPFEVFLSGAQMRDLGITYPMTNAQAMPLVTDAGVISDPGIDPNREEPYTLQWTFGIQRQLSDDLVWEIAYNGNHSVKTVYSPTMNRVDRLTGLPQDPNFGQFRYIMNADSVTYNALQTTLKKRLSQNLLFDVAYTYASNLSYYEADFSCCGGDAHGPQDLDRLDQNRGPTPFHIQHRFTTDFLYEIPSTRFQDSPVAKAILGSWSLSGLLELHSGGPLLIRQNLGASPGQRPDFVGKSFGDAIFDNWDQPLPNGRYQYLDPSQFSNVPIIRTSGAAERPGNLSRYAIHGPGFGSLDLALAKSFHPTERQKLQFRVDLFNALNQTNFTSVNTNSRSGSFGRITSVAPGRVTQLSVRYEF